MSTHEEKYEALAQRIGIPDLVARIPADRESVARAIASGDEYLNSIPIAKWDRAAEAWSCVPKQDARLYARRERCACCGNGTRYVVPPTSDLWRGVGLSLAERVCVLKHVALHHYTHATLDKTSEGC